MQKYRVLSFVLIHVLIFLHVAGVGQEHIGSIDFQEFFHAFLKIGTINAGVIMVFLALFSTLLFGRFFCGWACHFGAVQELSWVILQKLKITPKTVNSRLVTILPIFILIHFYILPNLEYAIYNPWKISLELNKPGIWTFLPGFVIGLLTFIIDGFLIVYFLGRKGFCRFICPWGAFLKLPSALAVYKVRNVGGCINSGNCTKNCPIGIDVSYEINNFQKVVNTNCTNCMICTDGCPTSALSYSYQNPVSEKYNLTDFFIGNKTHNENRISNYFSNFRSKDLLFGIQTLIIGFAIDGLFSMGHFLSFGIAIILSFFLLKEDISKKTRSILYFGTIITILWATSVKISINNGIKNYEIGNYKLSIKYLNYSTKMYPNKIGRHYVLLADAYFEIGDTVNAKRYAKIAQVINPNHHSVKQLLDKISK